MQLVRNGEVFILNKAVWCEVGLKLSDIGTRNVREYELNIRLGYAIVRLDN